MVIHALQGWAWQWEGGKGTDPGMTGGPAEDSEPVLETDVGRGSAGDLQ